MNDRMWSYAEILAFFLVFVVAIGCIPPLWSQVVNNCVALFKSPISTQTQSEIAQVVRLRFLFGAIGSVVGLALGVAAVTTLVPDWNATAWLTVMVLFTTLGSLAGCTFLPVRGRAAVVRPRRRSLNDYVPPAFRWVLRALVILPIGILVHFFLLWTDGQLAEMYTARGPDAPYVPATAVAYAVAAIAVYLWFEIIGRWVAARAAGEPSLESQRLSDALALAWFAQVGLGFFFLTSQMPTNWALFVPYTDDAASDLKMSLMIGAQLLIFAAVICLVLLLRFHPPTRNHLSSRLAAQVADAATVAP